MLSEVNGFGCDMCMLTDDYDRDPCPIASNDTHHWHLHPHEIMLDNSQHRQADMRHPDRNTEQHMKT